MAQSTKEFLLSIYLLTQHGISTLQEVPSNGLFVYLGLHAAGKVSDAPSPSLDSRTLELELQQLWM